MSDSQALLLEGTRPGVKCIVPWEGGWRWQRHSISISLIYDQIKTCDAMGEAPFDQFTNNDTLCHHPNHSVGQLQSLIVIQSDGGVNLMKSIPCCLSRPWNQWNIVEAIWKLIATRSMTTCVMAWTDQTIICWAVLASFADEMTEG